jgi:hypothetical protein
MEQVCPDQAAALGQQANANLNAQKNVVIGIVS